VIDSIACWRQYFIRIRTNLKAHAQVDYFRPDSLAEALEINTRDGIRIAAGCTDLFSATLQQRLTGPILDITGVAALRGITHGADGFRIGAATTWTDIVQADLPPAFDALKQAALEVGAIQIQNSGTVAGNLCNASPAADGVPPLLALDASVELQTTTGVRCVPLPEFITGVRETCLRPSEIVTAVTVPKTSLGRSKFLKLGARKHLVISIVMAAVRLDIQDGVVKAAAISVGSCSPVAARLPAVEAKLTGAPADAALASCILDADIAAALSPIADIRADAGYRYEAAAELVRRAVSDLTGDQRVAA
jgi:CO/xanthine dehydrogenase FAD-binding subunit